MSIYRVPVEIDYDGTGGPGVNVWHLSATGLVQNEELNLAEALDALEAFYTKLVSFYYGQTRIKIGQGIIKDPLGAPEYVPDDLRTVSGTSGAQGPNLVQIVVGWRTASATRSGRGRTFIGPLAGAANDAATGGPTAGIVTAVQTAATELVEDSASANGWAIGVLSTKTGVFRETTGASVKNRFGVLRSRRD